MDLSALGETGFAWIFFGIYLALVSLAAFVGIKKMSGFASFSVGSRNVSPVFVGMSLAANLTSAATFIINPGLIYLYGVSGVLGYAVAMPLGVFVGLIVFSKAFRTVGDEVTALTVPQWIGDRFNDRRLTIFFAVASLLQIAFLVLITVGLSRVLASVLGVDVFLAMAFVIIFPLIYIMFGGASAHTLTNSAQAMIMMVVAVILLASGAPYFADGISGFLGQLSDIDPVLAQPTNPDSLLFRDYFEVVACNFLIGIAIINQPHVMSKALYLKSARDVNKYLMSGILVLILFFAVILVGLYARLLMPEAASMMPDEVVPTYIVDVFGPFVRAVILIGLVAAGFSTMEGLLVALSTIFSNDVYQVIAKRAGTLSDDEIEARSVRYSRYFLIALAPVVALISYGQITNPELSVAILGQNGVYALFSATFVPILFGIFARGVPKTVVLVSAVTALIVHFGMYYGEITMYANNPAVPATAALLTSTAIALVGYWIWGQPALPDPEEAPATKADA
jgi:SSS family solute:Na+ symporter/sodium/pantothenate symporter